jgi:hypothetical protein
MKVAAHQPVYLPWLGWWYKMLHVHAFVILNNVQMMRGHGVGYRNDIKLNGKRHTLSVPVYRRGMINRQWRDMEIDPTQNFERKHIGAMRHAYSQAPFYKEVSEWLFPCYGQHTGVLMTLTLDIIFAVRDYLGLRTPVYLASRLGEWDDATERLVGITEALRGDTYVSGFGGAQYHGDFGDIKVEVYDFVHPVYPQIGDEFMPRLSIVDLLFNCGKESIKWLR